MPYIVREESGREGEQADVSRLLQVFNMADICRPCMLIVSQMPWRIWGDEHCMGSAVGNSQPGVSVDGRGAQVQEPLTTSAQTVPFIW